MYLSKDREQAPKSSKKMMIAAAAGLAVCGVATVSYVNQEDSMDFQNLSEHSEAQLAANFLNKIAGPCDKFYHDASKNFLAGQDAFLPQAKFMWEHKLLLTRYGKSAYRQTMSTMLDQIEELTDAQRDLENSYSYMNKYMRLTDSKIQGGAKWRVILKYSNKVANGCLLEEESLMDRKRKLTSLQKQAKANLEHMASVFDKEAKKDYQKWDCDAMYSPKPKQNKVSIVKILTEAVKEGFNIFNQVKGMLPEGAMAGLKIPGLPEGLTQNLGKGVKLFEQGKQVFEQFKDGDYGGALENIQSAYKEHAGGNKEFEDFEEDMFFDEDMTDLKFIGGESDSAYADRLKDWQNAVNMCKKEKQVFAQTIGKAKSTMLKVARTDIVRKELGEINDELANKAASYGEMVTKFVKSGVDSTPNDLELQAIRSTSASIYKKYISSEKFVNEAKKAANVKKAMLLQIGQ